LIGIDQQVDAFVDRRRIGRSRRKRPIGCAKIS